MKKYIYLLILSSGLLMLRFTGCEVIENPGRITIYLTDKPFPIEMIEEANITITKIEVRGKRDSEGNEFTTLLEDTIRVNLIDLRNGITAKLLDVEISAGSYDLVRLYVDEASLKIKGGGYFDVKVPSGSQTGIKIFVKPELIVGEGLSAELLIDFDLSKSFVLKGNIDKPNGINGFNFKPVLRAVNYSDAGRVEGSIKDPGANPLAEVSVWVEQDSVIAATLTNDAGYYNIIGLPTGIYSMFATKEDYDTIRNDIVIIAANKTTRNIVLTPR